MQSHPKKSIIACLHTEHVNTKEKMQEFADNNCQEYDVQITINSVMVPEWFERDWEKRSRTWYLLPPKSVHPNYSKKWLKDMKKDSLKDYNGMPKESPPPKETYLK